MDIEAWKFLKKGQKRHSEEYYNILENKCISVFRCDPINNENEESTVVRPIPTYFCAVLPHSRRLRRTRTVFTPAQLREMEGRFEKQKYLSITSRNAFAEQLKLTPWQVKVWFQNRRMKWKKEMLRKDPNAVTTRPKKGRPKKNEY